MDFAGLLFFLNLNLSEADVNDIMNEGLGKLFRFTPLTPQGRLTTV